MGKKRTVVVGEREKKKRAVTSPQRTKRRAGEIRLREATSQPQVGLRRVQMQRGEVTSQLRAGPPQKLIKRGAVGRVAVAKEKPQPRRQSRFLMWM